MSEKKRTQRESTFKQRLSPNQFAMARSLYEGKAITPGEVNQTTLGSMVRRGFINGTAEQMSMTAALQHALDVYYLMECPRRMTPGDITEHVSVLLAVRRKRGAK